MKLFIKTKKMTKKDLSNNIKFGLGTSLQETMLSCAETKQINKAVESGIPIDPTKLALAMEHTRTCKACREAFTKGSKA
jgi:hypothetical protein